MPSLAIAAIVGYLPRLVVSCGIYCCGVRSSSASHRLSHDALMTELCPRESRYIGERFGGALG